jgi:hypothetical protein
MQTDQQIFLTLPVKPARSTKLQAAWILQFSEDDITILMAERLLKPLGHPAKTAPKFFATIELLRLKDDPSWLSRATDAIRRYWEEKNKNRKPSKKRKGQAPLLAA